MLSWCIQHYIYVYFNASMALFQAFEVSLNYHEEKQHITVHSLIIFWYECEMVDLYGFTLVVTHTNTHKHVLYFSSADRLCVFILRVRLACSPFAPSHRIFVFCVQTKTCILRKETEVASLLQRVKMLLGNVYVCMFLSFYITLFQNNYGRISIKY